MLLTEHDLTPADKGSNAIPHPKPFKPVGVGGAGSRFSDDPMTGVPDTRGVARGEVVVTRIADTTK
ncbi:MAG TPA: hypothetical protein VKD65_04270, partial [Candidatus Angelobacter sp.]|nr:hypothetical protein [Candidatus Angelobacter sp.]